MSMLHVIDSAPRQKNWLHQTLSELGPSINIDRLDSANCDCAGLLVIDNGTDNDLLAVKSALELRQTRPGLMIAVVKLLDKDSSDGECLVRSRCTTDDHDNRLHMEATHAKALFRTMTPDFEVQIEPDAITFEYQA